MIKIGSFQFTLLHLYSYIVMLSILLIVVTTGVQANDVKVEASVSPRYIQLNERATLELKISGNTLMKHIGAPSFNFLPNFLAVPLGSVTTPRLVEDKLAVSMMWDYELIPQQAGEIALPDVRFSYQGVPYIANPGIITVGSVDRYVDTSTDGIHKVEVEVSKNRPYLNEAIEYRFRYLYTTVLPARESPLFTLPTFPDFLVEELPDKNVTTTRIKGRTYHVEEHVKRLYPQKTGKIIIQPAQLTLPVKGSPKTLKTEAIGLNVESLPELGKPKLFTGAIGEYIVTAKVDRRKLKVRQALTLSVQITGTGNINTVDAPKLTSISGFRTNPPILANSNVANARTFTYAIIPLRSGGLQLPGIEFSFFNPNKGTYQVSKTDPISLTVTPDPNDVVDIESGFSSWIVWFLLFILVLAIAVSGYLIYRSKVQSGNKGHKPDSLMSPSVQAVSALQSVDSGGNATSFIEALTKILHQYLCELQGLAYRQLTVQDIEDIYRQTEVSEVDQKELLEIIAKCDYHKFAPVPLSTDERQSLISRVETVINHIEET